MTARAGLGAAAAVVAMFTWTAHGQGQPAGADAIMKAITDHWAAINAGDSAAVERQHTSDLTMFMPEFQRRVVITSPEVQTLINKAKPNWKPRDIQVQMLGSVAVATFFLDGSVTYPDARADSRTRRVTEVWVNQGGTWKEAHHHDSVYSHHR